MGALGIDFANRPGSGMNTVYSAALVDSKVFISRNGFLSESTRTSIAGTPTLPVINLGGNNFISSIQVLVHAVTITLSFKSVDTNSVWVTAVRICVTLGSQRYN